MKPRKAIGDSLKAIVVALRGMEFGVVFLCSHRRDPTQKVIVATE